MTIGPANVVTAAFAGFWARKSDGHPGAKILAEGLKILQALVVWGDCISTTSPKGQKRRGRPQAPT